MAEATRTEKIVTTTEARYVLTLDSEEFEYLKDLMGSQDAYGVSRRIWEALDYPKDGPTQPETFQKGDKVTVLAGARSADGSSARFDGPATVSWGLDSEGDYTVTIDEDVNSGYVLPQYLVRR